MDVVSDHFGRILHAGHSHSGDANLNGSSNPAKGGGIGVFFLVPFLGCWIPYFLPVNRELLKYGLLFAAGLLFTMAIEHLMSYSAATVDTLTDASYPYVFLLVVMGYMFTWLTDITVNAIWERKAEQLARLTSKVGARAESPTAEERETATCCRKEGPGGAGGGLEAKNVPGRAKNECLCDANNCQCSQGNDVESAVLKAGTALGATLTGHKEVYAEMGVKELGVADLVLLLLAMCFHSVFEGLAVGLSGTSKDVWKNTAAIVPHKFFEGIALGASLKAQDESNSWLTAVYYSVSFSIMAPLGIGIGMGLQSSVNSNASKWVDAVGNAFAAGVFIFVCINHLIAKGLKQGQRDRWWTPMLKWFVCGLGVMTNSLMQLQ